MKKYLMTGMAALAICAAFTSCSKETNVYNPDVIQENEAAKVQQSYADAFIATFGQPAANHQWGFVNYATAKTRALSDYDSGSNKNRNQWAGIDGPFKLVVPTPLSEGQKLRVKTYFQEHRFLTYEVPDMENYFVQQVYGGDPSTAGSLSTEQYTSAVANSQPVIGAAHMDKLTIAGKDVWDFNGADNPNIAEDVLNNGATLNSGQFHSDQITLMLGTRPTYVGYETSEASILKDDCCALVSAQEIDDWINTNYGENYGKPVWYGKDEAGYDNSYWERSFVGLDYEEKNIEDCYTTPWGKDEFAKIWDFCSDPTNTHYVLFHEQYVEASTIANDYLLNPSGDKVRWLSDQVNQFLGENLGTNQNTFNKQATINGVNNVKYYDLDAVYSYVNQGALPKANNMEFIKNVGGRDYVFSDWIVTLAPAKSYVPEWDLRIICEDVNDKAKEGDPEDSDWDFNDLVLDVKFLGGDKVKMRVYAVGGTLPIRINKEDALEAHKLYEQPTNIMINTGAAAKFPNQAYESNGVYPVFERTISGVDEAYGRNIVIQVQKGESWYELTAKPGQPASKIGVMPDFVPCTERQDIRGRYTRFVEWVNKQEPDFWWRSTSNE